VTSWVRLIVCSKKSKGSGGAPGADVVDRVLDSAVASRRPWGLPLAILAAARGARQAVEASPEMILPAVRLIIGGLTCVLSLERPDDGRPAPYLHLSVSRQALPVAPCSPVEQGFLLSLFFAPHEFAFLSVAPGTTQPVTHYYLRLVDEQSSTDLAGRG
jgi:hypothetical protein